MTIKDDVISFDLSDFDGLSDYAKKAMPQYSGSEPFEDLFGRELTARVIQAKASLKRELIISPRIDSIVGGLVSASPEKLQAAESCLLELENLFKLPDVPPPPPLTDPKAVVG